MTDVEVLRIASSDITVRRMLDIMQRLADEGREVWIDGDRYAVMCRRDAE